MKTEQEIKKLFKEVVTLRAEIKANNLVWNDKQKATTRMFTKYVFILIILTVISIVTNVVLHVLVALNI